ncbi:Beta-(1,2)-xylosyltransferase [Vitis vinifera]|uniref:Beta-(1,2)-xylosyltransferase n=1 Tax=Vitis vinifera TaxID=29760 RepID=A0A438K0Y1_VITVI|nr:Beta-(1,2)-xylosyltransferase [Vitis vinifera]
MTPERIQMSIGGERLENVIGRKEEEELPEFEAGAFEVDAGERFGQRKLVDEEFLNRFVPQGAISRHTMRGLLDSIRLVGSSEFKCDQLTPFYFQKVKKIPVDNFIMDLYFQWIEEPTLLVTRFEYANLFHTFTDWYSAYVASRVTGLPNRPHLVFIDGHCRVFLVPLGYETALFKGLSENINCHGAFAHDLWQNPDDLKTARLSEFGEMIRAAFGFPVGRHRVLKPASGHNILFVRREDYVAHPRHGGKVESRLSNEQEVFDSLKNWASNYLECKINLVDGLFAHMPMKEQVRAIQDASVIIGAHGAGLTHIISARPKTVILEIISSLYRRPHFALISSGKAWSIMPLILMDHMLILEWLLISLTA